MAPINLPDGSQVSEIVLPNGATASEVIAPDGSTVFGNAIPDKQDLHARYSAKELSLSDGQTVSTWSDETGNGHDLTAGTAPTFRTSIINGNPVVRFDGVDDFLDVAFSTLSQPNHIFAVLQLPNYSGGNERAIAGESGPELHNFDTGLNDNWTMFAGNGFDTGDSADTNPHIFGLLYNGSSSEFRKDGSAIATGYVGTRSLGGLTLGSSQDQSSYGEVDVGEILLYPQDKSGVQSDVESYLSSEWGITV